MDCDQGLRHQAQQSRIECGDRECSCDVASYFAVIDVAPRMYGTSTSGMRTDPSG